MRMLDRTRPAFTLVEVLVVVAIIGIAGAIIVPQINKHGTLTIQAAGRLIISDLLVAQNEAIGQQEPRRIVFDVPGNSYRMTRDDGTTVGVSWKGGGAGAENYIIDFANDERFAGVVIVSADFGGDPMVEYNALGGPNSGGTIIIEFNETRYRITVAEFTGRVTIEPVTGG